MTDHTVPPIGMRMVKTAAAVLICLLVSTVSYTHLTLPTIFRV